MADISKITLPSGDTYNLKDASATHGMFFASYGYTTYNEVLAAYQAKEVVYCKASSGSNPASGSQNRLAFLAYVNNSETPTNFEFQYYRSVSSHTATQQGDQVYVYNLNSTSGWSVIVREAYSKVVAGTNLESSYSNSAITLNHSASGVTAASKGDASDQTPGFGDTFKALSGTVDAQGHLTAFEEHTVTVPNSVATTSAAGLMSSTDKETLDELSDNTVYTETVSNRDVVTIQNGSDCAVSSLKVNIDAVQSGSGDPSSSNIRKIRGWTGVDLRQAQENLWGGNELLYDVRSIVPGAIVSETDGHISYTSSSATNPDSSVFVGGLYNRGFRFKENTQYTIILTVYKNSGTATGICVTYTDGTYNSLSVSATQSKFTICHVTTAGKTVRFIEKVSFSGTLRIYAYESGIFEGAHTLDEYMPYIGKLTKISWPEAGTVYGGVLDVTKGELTVTHGQIESYDGEMLPGSWISDRDVSSSVTYNDISSSLTIDKTGGFSSTVGSVISFTTTNLWERTSFVPTAGQVYRITVSKVQSPATFTYISAVDSQNIVLNTTLAVSSLPVAGTASMCIRFDSSVAAVYVKSAKDGILKVEEVNNGTPTTGAQVVYELETPVVYQIAPAQITMYEGFNNLWANTGNIRELVYGRDTYDSLAGLTDVESSNTTYALSISDNRIILFPCRTLDRSTYIQSTFEYSRYIKGDTGVIASNSSYPYDFGESTFFLVSKYKKYTVTMGSDIFEYRAHFYTAGHSDYNIGVTNWCNGSEITCYDGVYNGQEYTRIRFDIRKTDLSYTVSDFYDCIAAFSFIRSDLAPGVTTYAELPVYDGTVVTS